MNFLDILLRTASVYLFVVIALRLFGKKELTQLSVTDLVFILLISNSVQSAMVGNDTSVLGGILAAGTLFVINFLLKQLQYRSKKLDTLIEGNPVMLIYEGKVIQKHMDQTEITLSELEAAVREHGVENILDVNLAVLEVDGNISVLSRNFHVKTSKKRRAHKYITR